MLIDEQQFKDVEKALSQKGTIREFVAEYGAITDRMMITLSDTVPDPLNISLKPNDRVLLASFDSEDAILGAVFNFVTKMPVSGMWMSQQKEGAQIPDQHLQSVFVDKVFKIMDEEKHRYPVCCLLNDAADITVIPVGDYLTRVFITPNHPSRMA